MGVTARQELCKQPIEKRRFAMEFAKLLDSSETITSISSIDHETIAGDSGNLSITIPTIEDGDQTDSQVHMWIENGTAGIKYRVEVTVVTSSTQILQGDGLIHILDR